MAKKKNDIDDLDFDNLDFDEIKFPGDENEKDGDPRSPVSKVTSSFAKGAREQFTKPQTIRRFATAALPKEYKSVFDAADLVSKEGSELYNSAVKELKPALPQIRRATRAVLPKVRRYLPDRLAKKLDNLTQEPSNYSGNQEDDEGAIATNLGEIFKVQLEANAQAREEDAAERRVNQRISDARQVSSVKHLGSIRAGIERLTAYQDQITAKFQQKSLELQYRQYFATRDILKQMVENSIRDKEHQEALLKNTSLPEYAKIRLSEASHQMLRDKLLGRIQGQLGSALSRVGKRLLGDLKNNVRGVVGGFADGIQMAGDTREMMAEMGISPTQMFGEQLGNMFANKMGQQLGSMIAPYANKMPGLKRAGGNAAYAMGTALEQVRNFGKNNEDASGFKGFMARMMVDMFPSLGRGSAKVGESAQLQADKPAQFDNLSRRSLVEIIPGYLSYIHREIAMLRTGKPADRLTYNMSKNTFTSMKESTADVLKGTMDGNAILNTRESLDKYVNQLLGGAKVDKKLAGRLRSQIYQDTIDGRQFTADRYTNPGERLKHLTEKDVAQLNALLGSQFRDRSGRINHDRVNPLVRGFNQLHESVIDPKDVIAGRMELGQVQELQDAGLIRWNEDSSEWEIDYDGIDKQVLSKDVTLTPAQQEARRKQQDENEYKARKSKVQAKLAMRKAKRTAGKVKGKVSDFVGKHVSEETRDWASDTYDGIQSARRDATKSIGSGLKSVADAVSETDAGKKAGKWLKRARVAGKRALRNVANRKFSRGGWTGPGDKFDEVGTVHANEIVWSEENIEQAGGREIVEAFRRAGLKGASKLAEAHRKGKTEAGKNLNQMGGKLATVYAADKLEPLLDPVKLMAGLYRDALSGKVLKSIDDIRGPVVDDQGNVVISTNQIATALFDASGRKLTALSKKAQDGVKTFYDKAKGHVQQEVKKRGGVIGIVKGLQKRAQDTYGTARKKIEDLYVAGQVEAKIEAAKLQAGEYYDQTSGKVLKSLADIKGPVVDRAGKVVLSASDLAGKLLDKDGKAMEDIGRQARAFLDRAQGAGQGLMRGLLHKAQPETEQYGDGRGGRRSKRLAKKLAQQGTHVNEATQAYYDTSVAIGQQQVELLGGILEAVMAGGVGGGGDGTAAPTGGGRMGWLRRGLGALGRGAVGGAKLYGNYVKSVVGGMWGAGKAVVGGVGALATRGTAGALGGMIGALSDVYVPGRKEPALLAFKMRNGDYLDKNTGKPVRSIRDIKGAVLNELGDVVLTEEEYASGLFNSRGRKLVGAITGAAGALIGGYAKLLGGGWNLVFAGMNRALSMATSIVRGSDENKPADVYVKDDMSAPRLRAVLMRSGKYRLVENGKPGKVIRGWKDITGPVIDDQGNEVLSAEEYDKGIVNWMGRPFGGLKRAVGGMLGGMASGAVGLVGAVGKAYFGVAKALVGVTGDAASWGIRSIGRLFGAFNPKHIVETDSKIVHWLESIHNVLDARLPGRKTRKGSMEDRFAEEAAKDQKRADSKAQAEAAKQASSGGILGAMARWLKEKTDSDDEDDEESGDTTIISGGGGGEGPSRRDRARERLKQRKRAKRRKGKLGALFRAKDAIGKRIPGRKLAGRMGKRLGRFRPRGGGLGGIAGGLAMGLGGDWLLDKTLGKSGAARSAADTAVNVAGTASMLGMIPGAAGAAGSALSAVGTGAAAVGSGLLGILGSPVVLAGAAIAAVGYGGYKLYKKFKYGRSGPMRSYRLLQYGIDPTETSQAEPVVKLEVMLADRVKGGGTSAKIDLEGINPDDIWDLFDLDTGWFTSDEKTAQRRQEWVHWFGSRFKPIFCAWVTTLKTVGKTVDLQDIDDKLPGSAKLKILDAVKSYENLYPITSKPLYDKAVINDPAVIKEAESKARAAATEESKKEGTGESAKGEAGKAVDVAGKAATAGTAAAAVANAKGAAKPSESKQTTTAATSATSPVVPKLPGMMTATAAIGGAAAVGTLGRVGVGRSLTALEAVRVRAYGLKELTGERVSTVLTLEAEILKDLSFDQSGQATYRGDLTALMKRTGNLTGTDATNPDSASMWMQWVTQRVLPVAVAYASAVRRASTTAKFDSIERGLKPDQLVTVAREVVAARTPTGGPIWAAVVSPWGTGETLNGDSNSTYASVLVLENAVQKSSKPMAEPTLPGQKGEQAKAQAKKDIAAGKPAGTGQGTSSWADRAKSFLSNATSGIWGGMKSAGAAIADRAQQTWEGGKQLVSDVVSGVTGFFGGGQPIKLKGTQAEREKLLIAEAIKAGIKDPTELAMFMAQVAHESGRFKTFEEGYKYSPSRALQVFPRYFKSAQQVEQLIAQHGPGAVLDAAYGNRMGNKQPGDGFKFRGRGAIQLTGRANYEAFAKASGIDVVNNPDLVASDPIVAAKASIWWWFNQNSRGIRQKAASGDVDKVTRIVNGGTNGLQDRKSLFSSYVKKFQGQSIDQIQKDAAEGSAQLAKTSANPVQAGVPRTGGTATTTGKPAVAAGGATPPKTTPAASTSTASAPAAPAAPAPAAPKAATSRVSAIPVPTITDRQSTQAVAASANPNAPAVMAQQTARVEQAAAADVRGKQTVENGRQIDQLAGIMTEQLAVQREMASHLVKAVAYLSAMSKQAPQAAAPQPPAPTQGAQPLRADAPQAPVQVKRKQSWG